MTVGREGGGGLVGPAAAGTLYGSTVVVLLLYTEGTEGTIGKLSIRQTPGVTFILAESINYTI